MSWMLRRAAAASAPTLARFSEMTKMRGYSSCPAWMAWGWPCMDKSRMAVIEPCKSSTRCVRMLHAIGCTWPSGGMSWMSWVTVIPGAATLKVAGVSAEDAIAKMGS